VSRNYPAPREVLSWARGFLSERVVDAAEPGESINRALGSKDNKPPKKYKEHGERRTDKEESLVRRKCRQKGGEERENFLSRSSPLGADQQVWEEGLAGTVLSCRVQRESQTQHLKKKLLLVRRALHSLPAWYASRREGTSPFNQESSTGHAGEKGGLLSVKRWEKRRGVHDRRTLKIAGKKAALENSSARDSTPMLSGGGRKIVYKGIFKQKDRTGGTAITIASINRWGDLDHVESAKGGRPESPSRGHALF